MKLPHLVRMGNNYKHIFEEEIVLRLIGNNNTTTTTTTNNNNNNKRCETWGKETIG